MWIKILCIKYILWRMLIAKSMFDVANMQRKNNTVKYVLMNHYELLNFDESMSKL